MEENIRNVLKRNAMLMAQAGPANQTSDLSNEEYRKIAELEKAAEVAYGELAGVYPRRIDPNTPIYKEDNWEPASLDDLQKARAIMIEVAKRNSKVQRARPNGDNVIEQMQWRLSKEAAEKAGTLTPADVRHYFIRQEGVGKQKPYFAPNATPYLTLGPFYNSGGGDVPKGNKTYVDFYKGIP